MEGAAKALERWRREAGLPLVLEVRHGWYRACSHVVQVAPMTATASCDRRTPATRRRRCLLPPAAQRRPLLICPAAQIFLQPWGAQAMAAAGEQDRGALLLAADSA